MSGYACVTSRWFVSLTRSDSDLASLVSSFLTPYVVPLFWMKLQLLPHFSELHILDWTCLYSLGGPI